MFQECGSDFFSDLERDYARNTIHSFLQKPTQNGGILLVTGPRGVGKTRLVDESLNQRNNGRLDPLRAFLGDPLRSRRLSLVRSPRCNRRIIVPVPVSPFLLQKLERSNLTNEELEFGLLRNLLFALTSAIDPRSRVRRHGRTLRSRLGFSRYWFSRTGLSTPGWGSASNVWSAIVPILLAIPGTVYLILIQA